MNAQLRPRSAFDLGLAAYLGSVVMWGNSMQGPDQVGVRWHIGVEPAAGPSL